MNYTSDKPPVLIITGYGVNCEAESKVAWEMAGADARLIHLHDLMAEPGQLRSFKALMFIGGFSFGDHMGSGHVLALRIRHRLRDELQPFILCYVKQRQLCHETPPVKVEELKS